MINFSAIPLDLRTPGQYAEFSSAKARKGLPTRNPRILLLGQKLAAGSAVALTLTRVTSPAGAIVSFGAASMLAQMAARVLKVNTFAEVWALPQADDGAAVAATKTVTYTGSPTAAGVVPLMIGGRQVNTAVASGLTATQVATAVAASVNAATDVPMTATSALGVVTLTARHPGLAGQGIDVRTTYYQEDVLPAGVTAAVADVTSGATDPSTAAAIAVLGDNPFDFIVTPYMSTANLTALETELASRWGPMRALDGIAISSTRGTQGSLSSFGDARNSQFVTCMGAKAPPGLTWEWAAELAGIVALYGFIDPGRPFQTLIMEGLLPPLSADQFTRTERELLLRDGISTFTVGNGGEVVIESLITMYQRDTAGNADTAYLSLNTVLLLSYLRWSLRLRIAQKFPRHKLADDGVPVTAGAAVVTPGVLRAELIAWARDLETAGLIENVDQFKRDLVVERDASDTNRANALIPPDLINQFTRFAASIEFRL